MCLVVAWELLMAERLTGRKFVITYTVICLDVWGHGPDECSSASDCPCVGQDDDGEDVHDPDKFNQGECDAEYTVNNMHRCGSIEVEADEVEYNIGSSHAFTSHAPDDDAIVQALIDNGHFKPSVKPNDVEFEGEWDATLFLESTKDGEPLFHLEYESSIAVP